MEALQYLGIIQVFSFSSSNLVSPGSQVMIGAMDDQGRFGPGKYQLFLQLRTSLDFVIEHF